MRLVLSVGDKVLAVAPLDKSKLGDPGYIDAKKRLLKSIHQFSLAASQEPTFYIEALSKANV